VTKIIYRSRDGRWSIKRAVDRHLVHDEDRPPGRSRGLVVPDRRRVVRLDAPDRTVGGRVRRGVEREVYDRAMADRVDIPAGLERRLFIEAGWQCAVPRCRTRGKDLLEIHHIVPWAEVRRHDYENMIVLCAICHKLVGEGPRQIDRKALRQVKANLAWISDHYSDLERRVLEFFADQRSTLVGPFGEAARRPGATAIALHGTMRILMMYLMKDGIVEIAPAGTEYAQLTAGTVTWVRSESTPFGPVPDVEHYRLTAKGVEFLDAWLGVQPLDEI